MYFLSPMLQQAICKTTSGRTDIRTNPTFGIDTEMIQGSFKLEPTAPDILGLRLQLDPIALLHFTRCLIDQLVVDLYLTGKKPSSVSDLNKPEVDAVIAAGRGFFPTKEKAEFRYQDRSEKDLLSGLSSW